MAAQLIDRKAIAAMINVKPETFRKRVEVRPDFPKPVLRLSRETVRWDLADVEKWLRSQRVAAQR